MLGMLPTQAMHAYIGSTLRSMEEVVASSNNNTTAYIIFSVQVNLFRFYSTTPCPLYDELEKCKFDTSC